MLSLEGWYDSWSDELEISLELEDDDLRDKGFANLELSDDELSEDELSEDDISDDESLELSW